MLEGISSKALSQGFDGYEYRNLVEGGTSIAVFDSANVRSPYEDLSKIIGAE
tara:strand:- start:3 stop:158 length:156 start_codon:yes stop_codon:yes gene_type:complete